jgi:hypothetical protein
MARQQLPFSPVPHHVLSPTTLAASRAIHARVPAVHSTHLTWLRQSQGRIQSVHLLAEQLQNLLPRGHNLFGSGSHNDAPENLVSGITVPGTRQMTYPVETVFARDLILSAGTTPE